MVERDVIWVGGDASGIKGYKDIDGRSRRLLRFGFASLKLGRKCSGEEVRDLFFGPGRSHAVLKVAGLKLINGQPECVRGLR